MALFSAGTSVPNEMRSRGDGGRTDYAESLSCGPGGGLLSSVVPNSAAFLEAPGRQPIAAGAVAFSADLQERRESLGAPGSPGRSAASSVARAPLSVSRRYYLQPPAAATGGRATACGGAAAVAPCASAASPPQVYRYKYFHIGNAPAASTGALPYSVSLSPAPSTWATPRDGADRRLQTQRPLHRAHPYGSSLLGRLVNKIATSLTSLSSLVPRASASKAQKNADTGGARGALPESHEEAAPHEVLHSPLQEPVYDCSIPCGGVNAYSLRQIAQPGAARVSAATANAAAPMASVLADAASAATGKNTRDTREDNAADSGGEFFWLSDQQRSLPYNQMRPAAAASRDAAAAVSTHPSKLLCEQGTYSSLAYHQQLQLQQRQMRPQQPLQQMQPQQQQVRRQQVQAAGPEGVPGGTGFGVDAGESSRQIGLAASAGWEYTDDARPYLPLSAGAVRRSIVAAGDTSRERRRAATAGLAAQQYSIYEVPRQRVLAESCFDPVLAGSVALDADAHTSVDASVVDRSAFLQQQQRQHTVLSKARDLGSARTAAENPPEEASLFYDDYGIPPSAGARGRFESSGRLLSEDGNSALLAQQRERLGQQQSQQEPSSRLLLPGNAGAFYLPVRKELPQEGWEAERQQQGVPAGGRVRLSDLQEETGTGVSLSRTSSNSFFLTVPDEGFSQARRRLHGGCEGASSSLFSHTVAPAWLSSASADLLDADTGAAGTTGESGAVAAARKQSSPPAKTAPRSNTGTGVTTRKAAHTTRCGTLLYPRQEQLTIEQLQKLYLRCQPLRWRVRLRDLLRQEAVVAAAAEGKQGQASGGRETVVAVGGTVGGISLPGEGKQAGAAVHHGATKEREGRRPSVDISSQTQQAREEQNRPEDATGRRRSAAEEAARSTQQGWNAVTQCEAALEEQEQQTAVADQIRSGDGSLSGKLNFSGDAVQQASSREDARKEEEKQPQQVPQSLSGVSGEDTSAASGFGLHEQGRKRDTTGGVVGTERVPAVSVCGAATQGTDVADGNKRSKLSSETAATDGGAGVARSLFGSDISGAGGAGVPSSTVFGSSSSSLFGVGRTAPVASNREEDKPEVGRGAEGQSSGAKASAGEKPDLSLFGKSSMSAKGGGPSSVSVPLSGSRSSSSFFEGVTASAAAHQQQQPDSTESTSGKTGATSSSLFGGTAPASRLFGGARNSSTPQQQQLQQLVAAETSATSQPPAHKQAEKEQPPHKENASTSSNEIKDAAAPSKATTMTTADGTGGAAAEKPAEGTTALPWWQQNLNKPCTVMPEEDFAPEADDEEEEGEEKPKEAEKELPPLKVPNIFGSTSSSSGGLFGSAATGTSSLSLFKTSAAPSYPPTSATSAAPTAAATGAAIGAPSLFGSAGAGAGLWNQKNSSGSSLFGGLKPSAAASATLVPSGSLFGGLDSSKQPSSQLPSANPDAPVGISSSTTGTSGEKQPTSLFGNLTAGSGAFATQKSSASLFGGSIFGNPVATSESTNSSQQAAGGLAAPAAGTGLFVFGASASGSTPPSAATTAAPAGHSQPASGGTTAVPSIFGSALQQSQQNSSGTGKRGRDAGDGAGAAATPAAKSLFGTAPAPTPPAGGGGPSLFGQRLPTGGSTLFGGGGTGSGGLFGTSGTVTGNAGQTETIAAGKTGLGGGSIFGDRGNSSSAPACVFGAARSVTPVFGSNSASTSKESVGGSTSPTAAGGGTAASGASAASGGSLGLFGSSSSNNNPFGFGGSTGGAGVSLFGGSTNTPSDGTRSATAEGSFSAAQPLWSAGKGTTTTQGAGLFSLASNTAGTSTGTSRVDAGAAAGGASNGMLQPPRSLFGESVSGNSSSAPGALGTRSTTGTQGGLSSGPSSLFGNAPAASPFTFGAAPSSAAAQQQQQQPAGPPSAPAAVAPTAGGTEAGNGANAFFGALPSGVRRPRLTIKRSKQ